MRTWIVSFLLAAAASVCSVEPSVAAAAPATEASAYPDPPLATPLTVLRPFAPPLQNWEPGNRGVDLAAFAGESVSATTPGVVVYAGLLAGRGVISIRDGMLRTTYEPVDPVVHAGDSIVAGQLIGHVSAAADACGQPGGCLHWGAMQADLYIDPMGLLRAPRVRLLPIWSG